MTTTSAHVAESRAQGLKGLLARRIQLEPLLAAGLPSYRTIIALDIEHSTRPQPHQRRAPEEDL